MAEPSRTTVPGAPRIRVTLLALALLGLPRPAAATGACEDLKLLRTLVGVSEGRGEWLVETAREGCEEVETDDGELEEQRGTLHVVEAVGRDGKTARRFLSETDPAAIRRYGKPGGEPPTEPATALEAYRKTGAFVSPATFIASPSGACRAVVEDGETRPDQAGFSETAVQLRLTSGGKELVAVPLGHHVLDEPGFAVHTLFLPTAREVWVWAGLPVCVGGPPPGYFGEDDAGDCYSEVQVVTQRLTLAAHPALAVCFGAAGGPAAPAAAPPAPATPGPR